MNLLKRIEIGRTIIEAVFATALFTFLSGIITGIKYALAMTVVNVAYDICFRREKTNE